MQLLENVSLKPYNTFRVNAVARYFASFKSVLDLQAILEDFSFQNMKLPRLVLGGGSNLLFTKDYEGLILKNEIMGIRNLREDDDYVYVQAGAGENWHQFVLYCIAKGWGGVENLSLIPGNIGASPMQNIGAY